MIGQCLERDVLPGPSAPDVRSIGATRLPLSPRDQLSVSLSPTGILSTANKSLGSNPSMYVTSRAVLSARGDNCCASCGCGRISGWTIHPRFPSMFFRQNVWRSSAVPVLPPKRQRSPSRFAVNAPKPCPPSICFRNIRDGADAIAVSHSSVGALSWENALSLWVFRSIAAIIGTVGRSFARQWPAKAILLTRQLNS